MGCAQKFRNGVEINKFFTGRLFATKKKKKSVCLGGDGGSVRAGGRESWKEMCHSEARYDIPSPCSRVFFTPILECT